MRKYMILIGQFVTQVKKDTMLFIACLAPFLAGVSIHFGIPFLENILTSYFGRTHILSPYYYVFDILLAMLTPILFSFVGAMVILTEYDDHIVEYMAVTPVQGRGYMASRLLFPGVVSLLINTVILRFFSITDIEWKNIIIYVIFTTILGTTTAMLMIAISSNKVEGMAVGKLSGVILLGAFVPIIIISRIQYLCSFLPSFWLGRYIVTKNYGNIFVGFGVSIVWYILLNKKIDRK